MTKPRTDDLLPSHPNEPYAYAPARVEEKDLQGTVDVSMFKTGLTPIQIVSVLPTLPDSKYPQGSVVFLTTDNKLYRSTGAAWTVAVPTVDLTGTITTAQIGDAQVTTVKIGDAQVTTQKIGDSQVTTAKIGDLQVSSAKLIDGSVLTAKLADLNVTLGKLAANSVDTSKIIDGSVLTAKLADLNVTLGKLAANSVDTSKLVDGSVIAAKVAANQLDLSKLTLALNAGLSFGDARNPLMNAGAESGQTYWDNVSVPITDSTKAHTGNKYFQHTNPLADWQTSSQVDDANVARYYEVNPGDIIKFGGWIYRESGGGEGYVLIRGLNKDKTILTYNGSTRTQAGAWTLVTGEYTVPAGEKYVGFQMESYNFGVVQTSVFRFDDVFFYRETPGADIVAGSITASRITAGTITANEIAALTILAGNIAAGAITTTKIAAGAVTANEIAANTITAGQIAADTITASQIAASAITSSELAANAVIAGKIAAGTIVANDIAAATITGAKIAANTITAGNITALTITAAEIAAATITGAKIAAGTITASNIAADTITANEIAASAITSNELAANAVVAGKIAAGTIVAADIAANTITAAKIAAATITATELATDSVTTNKILAGAVTAAKISVSQLDAISANLGTITAGLLRDTNSKFVADLANVLLSIVDNQAIAHREQLLSSMVSHSGLTAFNVDEIVDGSTATVGWHTDSAVSGAVLKVDVGSGVTRDFVGVRIFKDGGAYAGSYDIEYSDNDSSWTAASTGFIPLVDGWNTRSFTSAGAHRYWRLKLTNTPGAGSWLNELEFNVASGPVTRVRLGKLGSGNPNYGLQVFDAAGNIIMDFTGAKRILAVPVKDQGTKSATFVIDLTSGLTQQVMLGGSALRCLFAGQVDGGRYRVWFQQDTTGSRTLPVFDDVVMWANDTPPVLSTAPGAFDVIEFEYRANPSPRFSGMVIAQNVSLPTPQVQSVTTTAVAAGSTTHNVSMPASAATGDLLLMIFVCNVDSTLNTPSGWTAMTAKQDSSSITGRVYAKISVGTEGGTTVNVSTGTSVKAAAHVYRITKWHGNLSEVVASIATSATGQADPPSRTANVTDRSLWIAAGAHGSQTSLSTVPTNYTNGVETPSGGAASNCLLASARRALYALTEDPGAFLTSTANWISYTVTVRPPV